MKCLVIVPTTMHNYSFSAPLAWMFSKHIHKVTGIYGFELTKKLVKSHNFFIIELNWFIQLAEFQLLVEYIKKHNRSAKILFGGLYSSLKYKEIFNRYDVDYFIQGDNEVPMEMLLNAINPGKIPNVTGKNFENPVTYVFKKEDYKNMEFNLDWFPSYYRYIEKDQLYQLPMIITSKGGCTAVHKDCNYCMGSKHRELKKIYNRPPIVMSNDLLMNLLKKIEKKFDRASLLILSRYNYDFSNKYFDIDMNVEIDSPMPLEKIGEILHAFKKCVLSISVFDEGLSADMIRDNFEKITRLEDNDHRVLFFTYDPVASNLDIPRDHLLDTGDVLPQWAHWRFYTDLEQALIFSRHFYSQLDKEKKFSPEENRVKSHKPLCIKLIHCGNINIANPMDNREKNIFFMPMGLLALADVLEKTGVDVEVIHMDLEADRPITEILDFNRLDAVGFDCHWIKQSRVVLDTAGLIKKINPGVFIFLGGFSASLFAEEIVSGYSQVDAVIRGDAEIPLVELCRALRREIPWHKVQNLAWKNKDQHLNVNPFTYTGGTDEMDRMDFAAFHLLRNFEYYKSASKFWTGFSPISNSPLFFLEIGRGCQYTCGYCGGNCLAQYRMNNRRKTVVRSIAAIISTMKKALGCGFETFFTCLEFEGSAEWYIKLLNRVHEENLDINFVYESWQLPSRSLLNALSRNSRNVIIVISPETANLELREKNKDIRLFYTNEQLEKTLDYAVKKGNIKIQLFFGYYLAGDTQETIEETLSYILKLLLKYPHLLEIEYFNFFPDPGSPFFLEPEKYGIDMKVRKFADYIHYLKRYTQADMNLFKPKHISSVEDIKIRGKIRLLNHLFSFYRQSVSYILQRTGKPGIVLSFLERAEMSSSADYTFLPAEIKEMLLKHCAQMNIPDESLIQMIRWEGERNKSQPRKVLPSLRLDHTSSPVRHPGAKLDNGTTEFEEKNLQNIEFDI